MRFNMGFFAQWLIANGSMVAWVLSITLFDVSYTQTVVLAGLACIACFVLLAKFGGSSA